MNIEKTYFDCKRFESYTLPCPHRDDPNLTAVRNWHNQEATPSRFVGDENELAEAICAKCDDFEPISR